jgi:hypothetical protein
MCKYNNHENLETIKREALGVTFVSTRCRACRALIDNKIYYQGKEVNKERFSDLLNLTPNERLIVIALKLIQH